MLESNVRKGLSSSIYTGVKLFIFKKINNDNLLVIETQNNIKIRPKTSE